MSKQPVLKITNVSKVMNDKPILNNLNFEIYAGEIFGLLGPNGSGKTSTLRVIVGLSLIDKGDVLIHGVSTREHYTEAISHVGALIEMPDLYNYLTGYQNLLHYSRMHKGISKERILEVGHIVGLNKRLHEKVKFYSLGMKQRLGLAQALLHSPSLLILDEPTNGLDPAGIRELRNHLRMLSLEHNTAILVSSHLLSEIEQLCDKVAIIQHGEILKILTAEELTMPDELSIAYLQVEPIEHALLYLQQYHPQYEIEVTDRGIKIQLQKKKIPLLIKELLENHCKVFGIHYENPTLEDRFLEITNGNRI